MLELDNSLRRQLGMKQCSAWYRAAMYNSAAKRTRASRQGSSTASTARARQAKAPVQALVLHEYKVFAVTAKLELPRGKVVKAIDATSARAKVKALGWIVVSVSRM